MKPIETDRDLRRVLEDVAGSRSVAIDTEAAGYHRYFDRVCLLQLSTRDHTFVIDTLAVAGLEPLRPILENEATEVVFHDADYDLRLLSRDFGMSIRGLFDTKIAAQFLGEPSIGLAGLVEKFLGVTLEKGFQRADWARRPLPPEMIEYAAADTRYLLPLRDLLHQKLRALGRLEWAEEEFRLAEQVRWSTPVADPDAYMRLKGTRDLRPRQLAALRELYLWREDLARSRDAAPFRVMTNAAMIELARRMPGTRGGIAAVPGVPRSAVGRHADDLLEALERARSLPDAELPSRPRRPRRPPPDPSFDAAVDRLREVRDTASRDLDLDRGFLMPRTQLEDLARARPRTTDELLSVPGVRRWQVDAIGPALLSALQT